MDLRTYDVAVAKEFGIPAAVILNRISWSIEHHKKNNQVEFLIEGEWQMFNTYEDFAEYVPCSRATAARAIKALKEAGKIKTASKHRNAFNHTNFFSIPDPESKRSVRSSQIETIEGLKMTRSSSSYKSISKVLNIYKQNTAKESEMKKEKPPKQITATWGPEDPLRGVFKNLCKIEVCLKKFDVEDYAEYLQCLMETLDLSLAELTKLSFEWQEYHNDQTKKPKSPKASFRTWVNNYVERRNSYGSKRQPRKPERISDNPDKFKDWDDDKPF